MRDSESGHTTCEICSIHEEMLSKELRSVTS